MELRSAEKEINDLKLLYESVRQTKLVEFENEMSSSPSPSPMSSLLLSLPSIEPAEPDNDDGDTSETPTVCDTTPSTNTNTTDGADPSSSQATTAAVRSVAEILSALESLQGRLVEFQPRAQRFRKRLSEKDPVTGAPRYGEKTMKRVKEVLETVDALDNAVGVAFGTSPATTNNNMAADEETDTSGGRVNSAASSRPVVVDELRNYIQSQEMASLEDENKTKARLEQEERQRKEQQEREIEEQRRQQEEERLRVLAQEQELAKRAEEIRQAQRQARIDAETAEREWLDSITKGPGGVREQLNRLCESTKDDAVAQTTAITALITIFSQIVSHPEETNFRRIRRDHPKFNEDIGRHKGGSELLIAAGFEIGLIDDIPSFISKEPNLETDLDGWSNWFDLLKATLQILKEKKL